MIRFFRHYVPTRMVLLMIVEFLLLYFVGIYTAEHFGQYDPADPFVAQAAPYKPWLLATSMTLLISMFGLYDWEWTKGVRSLLARVLVCFLLGGLIMELGGALLPGLFAVGQELQMAVFIAGLSVIAIRLLFIQWGSVGAFKKRVLVLGSGSRAAKVEEMIAAGQTHGLNIVGYLPAGGTHHYVANDRLIEESGSLCDVVDRYDIEEVVVAVRERRGGGLPLADLLECKLRGTTILDLPAFFERQTGVLPLFSMNASWLIFAEGFQQGMMRDLVKRVFDLTVSFLLMIATLPLLLITAMLIRLESRGPIFYTQTRVGQYGEEFTIFKFRSMFTDAEKDGLPQWARKNDDRTTRVGRLIRRVRIDELPQLFNVFLGQMSFVGPRPERPYFVNELATQIPYYNSRHSVKPGITGWAQVRFTYGASIEDAMEKLQYDLYYVKNHSLFLDLMILLQTAQVVVSGKGAH
ncbi:MAG TPA: TIGR03013 family PEP-CTERM/XrtA system glycosyltransferase [Thiobacillaceae bacterium]|nr:TIGR03013 family PEP-CTERM/XrtA system glycosyltransferase [Thiobacillaceae bacterium]